MILDLTWLLRDMHNGLHYLCRFHKDHWLHLHVINCTCYQATCAIQWRFKLPMLAVFPHNLQFTCTRVSYYWSNSTCTSKFFSFISFLFLYVISYKYYSITLSPVRSFPSFPVGVQRIHQGAPGLTMWVMKPISPTTYLMLHSPMTRICTLFFFNR